MSEFYFDPSHSVNTDVVNVESHARTAPDGIEQNNKSYTGSDKMPVNGEWVGVKSHIRTSPDGILENNLSYDPPVGETGLKTVIHHEDPLKHVNQYKMDPLTFD